MFNPLIAVFLGWLIAGEYLSTRAMIGAGIVVGSVALLTSRKRDRKKDTKSDSAAAIARQEKRACQETAL